METIKIKEELEARLEIEFYAILDNHADRYIYNENNLSISIVGGNLNYCRATFDGDLQTSFWIHNTDKASAETIDSFIKSIERQLDR